jgi:hypothetical protein
MYLDSFKEELGSGFYCDALLARNPNHHLIKSINNHKTTVISLLGGWEARHVVHSDGFQWPVRSRKRGVQALFPSGQFDNSVDDCLLPKNVMSPLEACLHNGVHFFVLSRVLRGSI